MNITALDHLVLTVADMKRTIAFYTKVLGMQAVTFGNGRHALTFGTQKINLHQKGQEISPHALKPAAGSADLCLLTDTPLKDVLAHLEAIHVPVIEGIVSRTGAVGSIESIYIRDPDGNLLEISCYLK